MTFVMTITVGGRMRLFLLGRVVNRPRLSRGSRSRGHAKPQLDSSYATGELVRPASNSFVRARSHWKGDLGEASSRRYPLRQDANSFRWFRRVFERDRPHPHWGHWSRE